jgi:hypothetical protein
MCPLDEQTRYYPLKATTPLQVTSEPIKSLPTALGMTYDKAMARGWESKSVEEQQSLTGPGSDEARKQLGLEQANRKRQMQELDLQRERILSERTSSPVRRAALEAALADVESRIARLS